MLNPGTYVLYAAAPTTALTASVQTATTANLDGMLAATFLAEVIGFTGGTSVQLLVQVTLDGGTTYLDVVNFYFTAAGKKFLTMSGTAEIAIATYAALTASADGKNAGLMGPQYRAVVTTVGTFSSTSAALRLVAR